MAPSTVFFHWRRDNRRSSASRVPPGQPASKGARPAAKPPVADSPPQLPVIPNTPTLATTIGGSPVAADEQETQRSREIAPSLVVTKPCASEHHPSSPQPSSASLAVPPSCSKIQPRPDLSPDERPKDSVLTSQLNHSRLSFPSPHHDNGDSDSSKPISPQRQSFGKELLNTQAQAADGHKRSSTPGAVPAGHTRLMPSIPNGSPKDKPAVTQKDFRSDIAHSRRYAERDVSAESPHHRHGKAMLHLLNPVSLLAKRRSSQLARSRADGGSMGARSVVPAIPDDYDPRIRGNIVHDFSAPRPRQNLSTTPCLLRDDANLPNTQPPMHGEHGVPRSSNDPSNELTRQKMRHSEYSPVFREHFDDDGRLLQVENKAYLQSPLLVSPSNRDGEGSVPAFAKKLPLNLPDSSENATGRDAIDCAASPDQWNVDLPESQGQDEDVVEKVPQLSSGLPKHLKSNSSRFSFDMNAVESSAQEKYLEDKHKEKEAVRRANCQFEDGEFSDVDDDYDDIMDDAYDLEEKIPGVNVDAGGEGDSNVSGHGDMTNGSWFVPGLSPAIVNPSNPAGSNLATNSTLNVEHAQPSDTETTENPSRSQSYSPSLYDTPTPEGEINTQSGNTNGPGPSVNSAQTLGAMKPGVPQPFDDDDDLYFDDGEFGDLGDDVGGEKFDESIFDDETSHLYDRKSLAERLPSRLQETSGSDAPPDDDDSLERRANGPELKHVPSMASELQAASSANYGASERIPSTAPNKSGGGVLTEHNLEALHNALAKAANDAARAPSVSERSAGQESGALTADSHSGLVSDDSRLSQFVDTLGVDEAFEDFSHDGDDDALYDDHIIAAANAEALENDDEGFYGEEFGFYAQARGSCSSQLTNGGYFGPRGVEGIARSCSTRGKFREPSLTPITERSERSTRNSVISLTAHGTAHSNPSLSSPPLPQLVDMGTIDDEMSLDTLMKLRRGAFGGSNGSLRSSSTSPPPRPRSSSNRGSFAGLSDVSLTGLDSKIPHEWPTSDPDKERSPTGSCAEDEQARARRD